MEYEESDEGSVVRLLRASMAGKCREIKLLVKRGLSPDSCSRNYGDSLSPLCWAARHGHHDTVKTLLALGASPSKSDDVHPIHSAAERGNTEIIKTLVQAGARVDSLDMYKNTPLMIAALVGNIDACRCLLELGADPGRRNNLGNTASGQARNQETKNVFLALEAKREAEEIDKSLEDVEAKTKAKRL
jgi:ankyrin repeat protein